MSYPAFAAQMAIVNDLLCASSLLTWDSRTVMPPGAVEARGKQVATLVLLARTTLLSAETECLLDAADRSTTALPETSPERRSLTQTRSAINLHRRIPTDLQQQRVELRATSQAAWVEARSTNRFDLFQPFLERTVDLTRQFADALGWSDHPYNALISLFEPGETVASLDRLFTRLRSALIPVLRSVAAAPQPRTDFLNRDFPIDLQRTFGLRIAERFGYDLHRGRLDSTVHPFEISFTRDDVRITTRYNPNFLPSSLFGTLHETGHALYEQAVDPAFTRSPLTTDLLNLYAVGGVSFGAHESQSRLWENHVGRSAAFWRLHFPDLRNTFPDQLADVSPEEFLRAINQVSPGLVRVEADELTYDLHIMLRTEIERDLIGGALDVRDLPEAWNAAIHRDLGLTVPDNTRGVLQDIHWSGGQIGTFCNYTIGNVMAAQLFAAASQQDPNIVSALATGDYAPLRLWLTEHIYQHGRRFTRDELLVHATGRPLDPEPYIAYLTGKYLSLHNLTTT